MAYPASVTRLLEAFKELPGVGTRTAERLVFHLLRSPQGLAREMAAALTALADSVRTCGRCHALTQTDPCGVCADGTRDGHRLLVIEQPRDVAAFEEAGWRGRYHVLLGHVNPLEGVEARDLTLDQLAARIDVEQVREVVVATNPDYEGDATALHVARRLAGKGVSVTRIARGVASGSAIEYSNAAMLADALAGRVPLEHAP